MMLPSQEGALPLLSVPRLLHHLVQLVCARLAVRVDTARLAPPGVSPVLAQEVETWASATPADLQALIRHMAHDHLTWSEERMANELLFKLGCRWHHALAAGPQGGTS